MRFKLTWLRRRRADRRDLLREEVRRCAGWMAIIVEDAERLDLPVPGPARGCVRTWRTWGEHLAGRP